MITEKNLYSTLTLKIAGLEQEFEKMGEAHCAYKIAAFFAAFTKKQLRAGEQPEKIKSCFDAADYLLRKGDETVKHAMKNVFVFSVSQVLESGFAYPGELPPLFKEEFRKQVNASCI